MRLNAERAMPGSVLVITNKAKLVLDSLTRHSSSQVGLAIFFQHGTGGKEKSSLGPGLDLYAFHLAEHNSTVL